MLSRVVQQVLPRSSVPSARRATQVTQGCVCGVDALVVDARDGLAVVAAEDPGARVGGGVRPPASVNRYPFVSKEFEATVTSLDSMTVTRLVAVPTPSIWLE